MTAEFVGGVERCPDEVLDAVFGCDLEDPDSPVELCFFADGETVQVYEGDGDVLKGRVEVFLVVDVS
jgi:hypothetical protein